VVDRESREVVRAAREFQRYIVWAIRHAVEEGGVEQMFEEQGVVEFQAPDLARLGADVMVDAEYARYVGDRLEWLRSAGSRPVMKSRLASGFKPVIDRVLRTLPEALREGRRRLVYTKEDAEVKAIFARLLDNVGYNWVREWAVKWSGLHKLPSGTIVDVGAGFGHSTIAVLNHSQCKVVAIDPYPSNLDALLDYIKILGLENRVEVMVGRGEELSRVVKEADAVVAINILHWCVDPLRVLSEAARVAPRMLLLQGTYDDIRSRALNVVTWLLGSSVHPTRAELRRWIRDAGWRIAKYVRFPADTLLLAR